MNFRTALPKVFAPQFWEGRRRVHVDRISREWEASIDALPQLVCLLDDEGRVVRANRTLENWGLGPVAKARGRELHTILHGDCRQPDCYFRQFWEQSCIHLKAGQSCRQLADDTLLNRHLDIQLSRAKQHRSADDPSPIPFAVAVVADISGLKCAERTVQVLTKELEERVMNRTMELTRDNHLLFQHLDEQVRIKRDLQSSQKHYQRLLETMTEGVAALDLDGRISYVNEHLGNMLGYARDELLGHLAVEYIDESMVENWRGLMRSRLEGDRSPYELILKARDGHRVWTKISPNLIYDGADKCIGSFAVVTDITTRVEAEQILREYQEELHQLSTAVMAAQELERKRIASELHDGLGQILSAVKFSLETAMTRLNGHPREVSLITFSNIIPKIQWAIEEVRRISMDLRPSILDDLGILAALNWFCRGQRQAYADLELELRLDIQESEIPKTLRLAIFRIVQEALNNVAKHAHAERARVSLNKQDKLIVLEIVDQGCGLDPDEAASKRSAGLSGMGLTIMRERAESSGGLYRLQSTQGEGTCIRVEWPAA